jgi:ribosomal protein S13
VNLLGDNVDTIKKNRYYNGYSKKVGLDVNGEKTKNMFAVLSPECEAES